jgi:hypothetical protein
VWFEAGGKKNSQCRTRGALVAIDKCKFGVGSSRVSTAIAPPRKLDRFPFCSVTGKLLFVQRLVWMSAARCAMLAVRPGYGGVQMLEG